MSLRMRRGGATDAPPPPSQVYGPVAGAQAIRDGVGPRTVSSPGGGVSFNSASNIQTLINANASNTIFVASATGTYNNFRGIDWNNKHPRFYFPGAASSYSIVGVGGGSNQIGVGVNTSQVTWTGEIHGGTWTGYGSATSPLFMAAVYGVDVLEDAVFTANGQMGVHMAEGTSRASHCSFTSNGRYGITGGAGTPTVEYCYVFNNSTNQDPSYTEADSGGQKFTHTIGGVWRYNWFRSNKSWGLWLDGENESETINDNVCEDNVHAGIFYEIGNGAAVIEHNHLGNNGLGNGLFPINYGVNNGNLFISNSACDGTGVGGGPNVAGQVRYNNVDVSGNCMGISLVDHSGHVIQNKCRAWEVHHNRVYHRGASTTGRSGLFDLHNQNLITQPSAQNHFDYNEYHVLTPGGVYYESDGTYTFTQFQAQPQEAHGTEAGL